MKNKTQNLFVDEIQLLKRTIPSWKDIENDKIEFSRMGGLTNITYRVRDKTSKISSVVFKKFSVVEGLIQREHQNRIMIQGSMKGIVPKCFYADNKYRIEEDLTGATHPSNYELEDLGLIKKILIKMVGFHRIQLEAIKNMPLFGEYILSSQFIDKAKAIIDTKKFNLKQRQILNEILVYLDQEKLIELRAKLLPSQGSLVKLCHNDINNLNIMQKSGKIYLIDCQYSRYNYAAYDIANFLNQSCIFYEKQAQPYFEFLNDLLPTSQKIIEVCRLYLNQLKTPQKVNEQLVNKLAQDVQKCFGLCNFYWAVWSPMTKNDDINFDYMQHGKERLLRFKSTLSKLQNIG